MTKQAVAGLLAAVLLLGACGGDGEREASADDCPEPTAPEIAAAEFAEGRGILDGEEGSTLIDVEIAETDEQRQLGLMHRTCLEEDAGMVFIFFDESQGGFWMKNTLIPLSVAFFDVDGKILKILDMQPCEADPCEIYDPGVPYMGALEVNEGAFDGWGIEEGDEFHIVQNDRDQLSDLVHSVLRQHRVT
ncbi:MAG: DUF192 domain-containing protein [Actinomycetota bacterium]